MADQSDIWTPEDFDPGTLGDLAYVDYQDLVDDLRKDLALSGGDLQQQSITADEIAPQQIGTVMATAINPTANAINTLLTNWATLTSGTYLKAGAAGLTAQRAGVYIVEYYVRFDSGAGHRFMIEVLNGAANTNTYVGGPNDTTDGNGITVTDIQRLALGDTVSLGIYQDSGAAVTTPLARIDAIWVSN